MTNKSVRSLAKLVVLLAIPIVGSAQTPQPGGTLAIAGHSGQAPVIQINGRSYVDIEALAQITNGALSFQSNQITLTLPGSSAPAPAQAPPKSAFSSGFLRAGIEEMTVIREWRIAIVNAIKTNNPVTDNWVRPFRVSAESKLALTSAAVATDSDRQALELLRNEFSNMKQLSDQFLQMHKDATYIDPDSLADNSLDQKVLGCARGLAAMASNGQFQDEPSCH